MGEWIDFKQLREQLDFAAVLTQYGVPLKANSFGQHRSRCPLPGHPLQSTSLTFCANFKKKNWRCFGCGASGNILDLAVLMENLDPKNPADVRKVALLLRERFGAGGGNAPPAVQRQSTKPILGRENGNQRLENTKTDTKVELRELVNAPLDFALKNLSVEHPFFRQRKLLPFTIENFGLGYCTKGMFAGRIAIPLHNSQSELVGYVGQLADEFEVTAEQPAYLWPGTRDRNGTRLVFDRSKLLYHGHTIKGPVTDLVIVQSPESLWWVWQAGFLDVVALMGEGPSMEQSQAIVALVRKTGRVWLLTDGNKIGERCAADLFFDIGPQRFCTWLKLSKGTPADCEVDELREMLAWKVGK